MRLDITEKKEMNAALQREREKLRMRRIEMEQQLDLARSIQKRLMPRGAIPENTAFLLHPMDKVGGDICDIAELPGGEVSLFIGDVSGHGVPAALVTAMTRSIFAQVDEAIRFFMTPDIEHVRQKLQMLIFWAVAFVLEEQAYLQVFF